MWDTIAKILDYVTKIIVLPSVLWGSYLYIENRKLKSFEFEKQAKIIEAELELLNRQKQQNFLRYFELEPSDRRRQEDELDFKIKKKKAELQYCQRMKDYKWIFDK